MERVINKYLDKMDDMEALVEKEIDDIYATIDIKAVIADPVAEMMRIAAEIDALLDSHKEELLKDGFEFANAIKGKK